MLIGQPVAWAMSDNEHSDTLQAVWSAVHKRCPSAMVSTIMTDDGMHTLLTYVLWNPCNKDSKVNQFSL